MPDYQFAADAPEIPENGMKLVEVDEQLVLILKVDGQYYCIDDVCTHDGGTLCNGQLDGHAIACPRHGATFDIRNGAALKMPATQPTGVHEIKLDDGQLLVRLNQQ